MGVKGEDGKGTRGRQWPCLGVDMRFAFVFAWRFERERKKFQL